ncbi:MAG TPA: hemerythrin domain-containing protein [Myxococcaceae bacterium]|nr:hemerythrin domain-containing protein [Myxococcaceae bacterium]
MDAITLLERDHEEVDALFNRFERTSGSRERRHIADQVIEALSRHAAIEEQFFYPAIRERSRRSEEIALEALEEHHVVKWLLFELAKMQPSEERFEAKMTVLAENVRHHIEDERKELFPLVRRVFQREELADLGVLMAEAKRMAPTRPHPRSPDTPPGNLFTGAVAAVLDRGRDFISGEKRLPRRISAKLSRRRSGGSNRRRRGSTSARGRRSNRSGSAGSRRTRRSSRR